MSSRIARGALALGIACLAASVAGAADERLAALKGLRLQGLAPVAGEAVFRFPDGRLEAIVEGRELTGTGAVLVEVLADRAVVRVEVEGRQQTAWMYPSTEPGKPGRIKMLRLDPADAPQPQQPSPPAKASPPPGS